MFNSQLQYELATDPLWDKPAMTAVEYEVSMLSAEKKAMVEQTADDLGCTVEQAYQELKDIGEI